MPPSNATSVNAALANDTTAGAAMANATIWLMPPHGKCHYANATMQTPSWLRPTQHDKCKSL